MKLRHFRLLLLLTMVIRPQHGLSQTSNKPAEPDYIGVVAALDPSSNTLIALESQTATYRTQVKALGFAGGEAFLEVSGEKSPVRFKAGQKIEFVARVDSQQTNPQESLAFIAWRPDKGTRRVTVGKVGGFGSRGHTVGTAESAVPFDAVKYGESSFKIVPTSTLQPGEYGFRYRGHNPASRATVFVLFSFGVNSASVLSSERPKEELRQEKPRSSGEKPVTNDDVIAMLKAGLGDDLTISKIKQAQTANFDVSADALIRMKKEGASKAVIDAVMKRAAQVKPE